MDEWFKFTRLYTNARATPSAASPPATPSMTVLPIGDGRAFDWTTKYADKPRHVVVPITLHDVQDDTGDRGDDAVCCDIVVYFFLPFSSASRAAFRAAASSFFF